MRFDLSDEEWTVIEPLWLMGGRGTMKYIEKVLLPDEEIRYTAKIHWIVYLTPVIFLALAIYCLSSGEEGWVIFGFILFIIGIFYLVGAFIQRWTTELVVTSQRVLAKVGFIKRKTWEINSPKVEGVQIDQSVLGRILGYGTLTVKGTGSGIAPIKNVVDPLEFRKHVTTA